MDAKHSDESRTSYNCRDGSTKTCEVVNLQTEQLPGRRLSISMINLSTNNFDISPPFLPEGATRNTNKAEEEIVIDETLTNDLCDDLLPDQLLLRDTKPTLSSIDQNGMQGMYK